MNKRTLLFGFWLFGGVYITMVILGISILGLKIKPEITAGDIISVLLGLTIAGLIALYWIRLYRRPFKMRFYHKSWEAEDNPGFRSMIVDSTANESKRVFIGIKLRLQRRFQTIDIRFVERKFCFIFRDAPKHRVIMAEDEQFPFSKRDDNKRGGIEALYSESVDCPKGDIMWYEITVQSSTSWSGYLSFQLRRGSSHRGLVRQPFCFKVR